MKKLILSFALFIAKAIDKAEKEEAGYKG